MQIMRDAVLHHVFLFSDVSSERKRGCGSHEGC